MESKEHAAEKTSNVVGENAPCAAVEALQGGRHWFGDCFFHIARSLAVLGSVFIGPEIIRTYVTGIGDVICVPRKRVHQGNQELQCASTMTEPLQSELPRMSLDHFHCLRPETSNLLVVIDYFTKWPEAYPLPNQEATTVAEVLVKEFVSQFGSATRNSLRPRTKL